MSYRRGEDSLEVEVSRLQSWIEATDVELYGKNGDRGMIREHHDDRAAQAAQQKFYRRIAGVCALFGSFPAIIKALELVHVLPK